MSLKLCSLAARGLWIEMLAIMGISERNGYLQIGGKAITEQQLAVMAGVPVDQVILLIQELETNKVFSRDENGIPYCRRMAREFDTFTKAREYGKLGGNPELKKEAIVQKLEAKGGITPPVKGRVNPNFDAFWKAYPRKVDKKKAIKAFNNATDMPDIETVIKSIEEQKKSKNWIKDGGQFIPYPASWLNAGGWDNVAHAPIAPRLTPDQRLVLQDERDELQKQLRLGTATGPEITARIKEIELQLIKA